MASIDITRKHSLSNEDVKAKIESLRTELEKKYSLKCSWKNNEVLDIAGTGVKNGNITLSSGLVQIAINLTFLGSPFKSKIETRINEYMDANLK
ncbi:polyhydroxyalkanoic acid system family protein [Myxococcota bacterium]|nr:polyhydroxyalkanoic acid system family protein [Myxococcota bacterium]MBU1379695.1 polyhydroxyalkanoic acid system family protein [Myxococcota bacterium]MBU1496906.1 polyhydroxyalkanoic acid system family protein [Myxococcota bacterium]